MDQADQDDQTLKQQSEIAHAVAADQPLISSKIAVSDLEEEYKQNPLPGFVQGIQYLNTVYSAMRKVRGDGNCFYRALLYRTLERLVQLRDVDETKAVSERDQLLTIVQLSKEVLINIGYSELAIESFWDVFVDVLQNLFSLSADALLEKMNEEGGEGDYMVWYCRLLTAGHLKINPDKYMAFVDAIAPGMDLEAFCQSEVEPMGKECEQIQMTALTECLNLHVRVEYLDGHDFTTALGKVILPNEDRPPAITLLYRPGHYDVLYEQA